MACFFLLAAFDEIVDSPIQKLCNLEKTQTQHQTQNTPKVGHQIDSCHSEDTFGQLHLRSKDQDDLVVGAGLPPNQLVHNPQSGAGLGALL